MYSIVLQSPVDGNAGEGEDTADDDDSLHVAAEFAQRLAERPLIVQLIQQLERHVGAGDERVAEGERHEEHVGDGAQLTTRRDDDDDEDVGTQRRDDDGDVHEHEQHFRLR